MRFVAFPWQQRLRLDGKLIELHITDVVLLDHLPAVLVRKKERLLGHTVPTPLLDVFHLLCTRDVVDERCLPRMMPLEAVIEPSDPELHTGRLSPDEPHDLPRRVVDHLHGVADRED